MLLISIHIWLLQVAVLYVAVAAVPQSKDNNKHKKSNQSSQRLNCTWSGLEFAHLHVVTVPAVDVAAHLRQ